MPAAIGALEAGLRAEARGVATNMHKTHVAWDHGTLHAIGAVFPEEGVAGTKTWAHTPGGAMPLVILFDSRSGALQAIVEAFALGQLRTAAASGLATMLLASDAADDLAIVGTGRQALPQVAAVQAVRPLRRVRVHGRDPDRRELCVARVRSELGLTAEASPDVAEAVRGASIITLATRAREPFLFSSMVAPGAHINAIGAIVPTGAEVGGDVLARCSRIAADSPAQARRLSRELIEFFGENEAGWAHVSRLADLVAAGTRRMPADDVTLFKSLGMGISDLALGIQIYRGAQRAGLGRPIETPHQAAPRLRADRTS
jgi:ornithine cyclodeaminase